MVLTTTEEYQEIKIVTRYNFSDMAQITGVSSGTHHTLTLVLNSVPERRKPWLPVPRGHPVRPGVQ